MQVKPYLYLQGRCEEAINFYRKALGAEPTMLMRYKDSSEPPQPGMIPPCARNKVMHSSFRIGETTGMASDGLCSGKPDFSSVSPTIAASNESETEQLFAALGNGQVLMPLTKAFFSSRFGMVADRFGVSWMIIAMPWQPT